MSATSGDSDRKALSGDEVADEGEYKAIEFGVQHMRIRFCFDR